MTVVYAQPVDLNYRSYTQPIPPAGIQLRTAVTEICNNQIDDDNNGLTDEKDFACYLNEPGTASCNASSVIWACEAFGSLLWVDISTGMQKHVGKIPVALVDITWAANGKLYGCGGPINGIYEIDPYTANAQFITRLDNHVVGNSMTADAAGNLYVVAYGPATEMWIVKVNLITWEMCFIADLAPAGIDPAGDLTFLNGMLYLTCGNNLMAKIDVRTGAITTQKFINSTTPGYFGITNTGDGYLYVCDKGDIYRVDPVTMTVNSSPTITIGNGNNYIYGLAGYTELCKAPYCTAKTSIQAGEMPPYCTNLSIKLKGEITPCNNKVTAVSWTTPAGNTVNGDQVKATQAGKYYLNYQTTTGTCTRMDSFTLQYAANAPLKVDTSYNEPIGCACSGSMTVIPGCGSGNFTYEWSNGAATATVYNVCPGSYSVKVTDIDWHKDTTIQFIIPPSDNTIRNASIVTESEHCKQQDGAITINKVQGGTVPYKYALNDQPPGNAAAFTHLPAGNYTITIHDNAGCSLQQQVTIQSVPAPEKILYTKKDAYCGLPAGTLIIDSVRKGSPPFTYSINNSAFTTQTTFTNIAPGPNTLCVKDSNGCLLNESLTINRSEALRIAISPRDTTICATQQISFRALLLSSNSGVQYVWDNREPVAQPVFSTAILNDTKITVKAIDRNGCILIDSAFVKIEYCDNLFAHCVQFPSAFTPNRDGRNDTFGAHIGQCEIKKYKMAVYNRWGQMIFQTTDFYQRWNGTINGNLQEPGVYVFNCVWEDALGMPHTVRGSLVLIK